VSYSTLYHHNPLCFTPDLKGTATAMVPLRPVATPVTGQRPLVLPPLCPPMDHRQWTNCFFIFIYSQSPIAASFENPPHLHHTAKAFTHHVVRSSLNCIFPRWPFVSSRIRHGGGQAWCHCGWHSWKGYGCFGYVSTKCCGFLWFLGGVLIFFLLVVLFVWSCRC